MNNLFVSTVLSWLARAGTISFQLFLIPTLVNQFGLVDYGKIVLLQSLIVWFSLMDYGGGVLFQNKFSLKTIEIDTNEKLSTYIIVFFLICVLVPIVCYLASGYLSAFLIGSSEYEELLQLSVIYLSLSVFLDFFVKILYARQKSIFVSVQIVLSTVTSFFLMLFYDISTLSGVLSIIFIPQILLKLLLAAYVFHGIIVFKFPDFNRLRKNLKGILVRTTPFLWFALVACVTLNIDILIANSIMSELDVAVYLLLSRIYSMGFVFYSSLITILWPRFVNIIQERKIKELNRLLRNVFSCFTFLIVMCSFILYFSFEKFGSLFFDEFALKQLVLSPYLVFAFCIYYIVRVITDCYSALLQCCGETKVLTRIVPIQALLSVVLQLSLGTYFGAEGIVSGVVLSFLLSVTILLPITFYNYAKGE